MKQIIVVGGGAAGMIAAGTAASRGFGVTVAEHMPRPCRKVRITGKGRCNLTNNCPPAEVLAHVQANPKFLWSSVSAFPPSAVMALFESLGVPLKTEHGRRVFPLSDHAQDIADALCRYAAGCRIMQADADSVAVDNGAVSGVVLRDGRMLAADGVILATGGLSYPATGSTGDGYRIAAQLGHTIVPTCPSLVALRAEGGDCRRMAGLSLRNVRCTLFSGEKELYSEQGEMLFTHTGVSGPLILSASAFLRGAVDPSSARVEIDWKPALDEETLYARLTRDFEKYAAREAPHGLVDLLPQSSIPVFLDRWGIDPQKRCSQITREEKHTLVMLLRHFSLRITGRDDTERAVVTAGGVSVREVDPRTMESKIVRNLHFAGELLDVDACTGGYNLQIAFSTGRAAGAHILERG